MWGWGRGSSTDTIKQLVIYSPDGAITYHTVPFNAVRYGTVRYGTAQHSTAKGVTWNRSTAGEVVNGTAKYNKEEHNTT